MTLTIRLTLCAGLALVAACGDNSKECGEGTVDLDGSCVAETVPPVTCTDGTLFDAATNTCVIDPAVCQEGTVLIRGRCQDPTAGVSADLEEGAEPNGFDVAGEPSVAPAGVITMPSIGSPGVVLHGTITPQPDRNGDGVPEADVDTFVISAAGPTVLEITVDGVNGLQGGFMVLGDAAGLEMWSRGGLPLFGDTARRRLFLPAAGTYRIGIADARSLTIPAAIAGGEDTEYYVTIDQRSRTTPLPITLTAGAATQMGTLEPLAVHFFTAPLGAGQNDLVLSSSYEGTMGSVLVLVEDALAGFADESKLLGVSLDAELEIVGVQPGEDVTIVVDHRITGTTAAVPFALDIVARSTLR